MPTFGLQKQYALLQKLPEIIYVALLSDTTPVMESKQTH